MQPSVDFIPYQTIAERSWQFIHDMGMSSDIPINIELIVEKKLGLHVVPASNLQQIYSVDGFISSDFKWIYVDEFVFNNRPTRYRFTLAHEIGHYVLHKKILQEVKINSIAEWKAFVETLDEKSLGNFEFQSYAFGGLALVPQPFLRDSFFKLLPEVIDLIDRAKIAGLTKEDYSDYAQSNIASRLAPIFDVSEEVVVRRLGFDRLEKHIP